MYTNKVNEWGDKELKKYQSNLTETQQEIGGVVLFTVKAIYGKQVSFKVTFP